MSAGAAAPEQDAVVRTPEEIIEHIVLDIKSLAAERAWDAAVTEGLRERLLASHDEDVKRFVDALEPRRPSRPWSLILIGMGELVLGAFLTVAGLVFIVPAILGFTSRGEIARYVSDFAAGLSSSTLSDPLVVALGFGFALFLLLAALYTLRQASKSLRDSGLVAPPA